MIPSRRLPRVLAVSSGGGHWIELMRLRPAFDGCDVAYATVGDGHRPEVAPARYYAIPDATRWSRAAVLRLAVRLLWIILRERPHTVVTTGAAPGYLAIWIARRLGARTVWLDSIANVDELSLSGRLAGGCADLWLTQWPHLARPGGPRFEGAVL